jgi:hypothetical protein
MPDEKNIKLIGGLVETMGVKVMVSPSASE